jgi:hypothetical protein
VAVVVAGYFRYTFVLTGKCTAIYEEFLRKIDLTGKYVGKIASYVPID